MKLRRMSHTSVSRRTVRRPARAAAGLGLACLVLGARALVGAPPDYEGRRWALVFEDEFDGAALDQRKWSYHYPWSRTHNHDAYSRSENVTVGNGILTLTAREESFGGKPYTTGVVNTNGKFHTTYGYIEARMRMPASRGSWPAFWMLEDGWPPEIDIMEFPLSDTSPERNEKYRYWWNYHWGTVSDHRSAGSEVWQGSDLTQGFHNYAVEWTPDVMRFFLDGVERGVVTNRDAIAQSDGMYVILNFAVGGWPGSPPSWPAGGDTFQIDHVRVWRLEEPAELIDLGRVVGGGDGRRNAAAPSIGINPDTGAFGDDLGLDSVGQTGANPQPVASPYIDSVFLLLDDIPVINTSGTRFRLPAGDATGGSWDLIANTVEPDGPTGMLRLGPKGPFTRGIGMHASSGITFDLGALRSRHGDDSVGFFSAFAGEGSYQSGGLVNSHVVLADGDGRLLHAVSTGPHADNGRFVELELPRSARYLTLVTGAGGNGNGQDHGVFCNAFITPCRVGDPSDCGPPADEMLVFSGASWLYLDEGPAPPAAWTDKGFSTAGWSSGRAQLGYGDGDETTEIGFGGDASAKRITAYFRRNFVARQVDEITTLRLSLLRDDGARVFLNGVEVLRAGLPAGPIGDATLASTTVDTDLEGRWDVVEIDSCLLVEGTNVLAVDVHQAAPTSSDLSFDLALAAERDPAVPSPCGVPFIRGDCNGDGQIIGSISDPVFMLQFNFVAGPPPTCLVACDVNGDGRVIGEVSDAIYLLQFNFLGGPPPPAPFPACGPPGRDSDLALGCDLIGEGCP